MAINRNAYRPPALAGINGPIQNTGCGDDKWITVRDKATGGVVANGVTVCTYHGDGDRYIYVANCPIINIAVDFTKGSLTNAQLYPYFTSIGRSGDVYQPGVLDVTAGSGAIIPLASYYYWTADFTGVFQLVNPGGYWVYFITASVGTTTGSSMGIKICRGWGEFFNVSV